jgi:hypothetical protein
MQLLINILLLYFFVTNIILKLREKMKRIILSVAVMGTMLSANALESLAKDAVVANAKSEMKTAAVTTVASTTGVSKEVVSQAADKVMGKESAAESLKAQAANMVGNSKATSTTDLTDMVVEKVVGKDAMKKEMAHTLINAVK